jgi:hypothetical protein
MIVHLSIKEFNETLVALRTLLLIHFDYPMKEREW